jgi:protein O-GlcNAc transferase
MTPHEATEQGVKAHQGGRLAEAESFYAAALKAQPDFFPALRLLGALCLQQRDFDAAQDWFSRAIAAEPKSVQAPLFASRGEASLELGRAEEALGDFDRALAADPGLTATWNNHGAALNALKRFDEALVSYDRALALIPQSAAVHNNRGDALRELRRFDEALLSFNRALAITPSDWACLNNRAVALSQMGRMDEALESYNRALTFNPDFPAALHGRGNLFWSQKALLVPALADLDRLVEVAPDFPFARGSRMRLAMTAARWDNFDNEKALIDAGVRADRSVIEPFMYLALSDRPDDYERCASLYARSRFPARPPLWKDGVRRPGRIRLGYVCGEFWNHPTLYLMAGLFESHDRKQFEIFAFDNGGGDGSPLRARFDAAVENIVNIALLSDATAAAHIRAKEIDILVDLNGYSGEMRPGIFARRPAQVQVSYLAYPGTTGAPYMDYILADRVVIPEDEERFYSEKVALLPHSYQINDDNRAIAETPARAVAGLPADSFVFCNFNDAKKFTPATFACWMRILDQVSGSVLWLLTPDPLAQKNLKREASQRGIDPTRLIFGEMLALEKHLARLKLADLFLDGLPYGAHTTSSDALWAGLPLLTCRGHTFAGRVAASLLQAVGLSEMVMESTEAFEAMAVRLAHDPRLLGRIREKLAENRASAPLFDTERTTRDIEKAFQIMFENRDRPPHGFAVAPD